MTFIYRHVPAVISYVLLASLMFGIVVAVFLYAKKYAPPEIFIQNSENEKIDFTYGSWPALQNADFFKKTKDEFISQGVSFIEADLSAMIIRFYQNGKVAKEAAIQTKGRDGSWWETPAGLYKVISKEKNHFSSFGKVYQPYSIQFQGNFFIHGWPYYSNGEPVGSTYSGGCIRLSTSDAKEFYELAEKGTPVLVFEESFNGNKKQTAEYINKTLLPDDILYLAADLENNFVFAENNSRKNHSIASITKLISALVAVEYINVEREITINSSMLATTSIPRLKAGESISVLDLLSYMLLESSNEASQAITAPLGQGQFINLMNTKAGAIGMANSSFADTSGISAENVSTVEDLFHLAKYLYYNRSFILQMTMAKENRGAYGPSRYYNLKNLNLIPDTVGMVGGKVGLSSASGDSMLSVFEVDINGQKRPIAIIVLGSKDAKSDIKTLLNYISGNFSLTRIF